MKSAAFLALGILLAASPAFARAHHHRHHMSHHMSRHHAYQSAYHSESDEQQATAELNKQYRGVPSDH